MPETDNKTSHEKPVEHDLWNFMLDVETFGLMTGVFFFAIGIGCMYMYHLNLLQLMFAFFIAFLGLLLFDVWVYTKFWTILDQILRKKVSHAQEDHP